MFGTKEDQYTDFPEKWGFKNRRAVVQTDSWKAKKDGYEARLAGLNPKRAQDGLKGVGKKWNGRFAPAGRWDEIHEESGLRIKHATCILMKNQYITSYEAFVAAYLDGAKGESRGTGGATPVSTSAFVTNHEIYRMFAGKHRKRILDNTLFADGKLKVVKPGKIRNTANPLRAMLTEKTFKDPIGRWYRVKFKSL